MPQLPVSRGRSCRQARQCSAGTVSAGYAGAFDLEILGPTIEEEGYRAPIARSLERATEMLDRLGA